MKKLLITGGAGFIGSNLVKLALAEYPEYEVVVLDALTYAGNLASLADVAKHPRYRFVKGDVTDRDAVSAAMQGCWGALHLAAESHVDRSILDPGPFLRTNVMGTQVMLDVARHCGIQRYVQVSTDEVYGSLGHDDPAFVETLPLAPNSPYSASKAGADLLVRAYVKTFDFPAIITRCSNNYGPYQFPEKLLPLLIKNALADKPIPVYGDGMQVRDWIYVEDHCRGLMAVLEHGQTGEIYNLGGASELHNLHLIRAVLKALGKPESLITFVKDRAAHDRRYAMDCRKIEAELGWQPLHSFNDALQRTVDWYQANSTWVEGVVSGDYMEYYERQYGGR